MAAEYHRLDRVFQRAQLVRRKPARSSVTKSTCAASRPSNSQSSRNTSRVPSGTTSDRFTRQRSAGLDATYRSLLAEAAPELARSIGVAPPVGTLRAFPGQPGWIRASAGPGWALVGDAGYFKDPITAHGITDALRDAELLARAVLEAPHSRHFQLKALRDYEDTRDRLSEPLFDITERIASYNWDLPELRWHLRELSEAMRREVDELLALDQTSAA